MVAGNPDEVCTCDGHRNRWGEVTRVPRERTLDEVEVAIGVQSDIVVLPLQPDAGVFAEYTKDAVKAVRHAFD